MAAARPVAQHVVGESIPPYTPPTVESVLRTRGKPGPKPVFPPAVRICTECGRTKEVAEFTPIALSKSGYYGGCRECRRSPQRYASSAASALGYPGTKAYIRSLAGSSFGRAIHVGFVGSYCR
jgi:hypothetical protein